MSVLPAAKRRVLVAEDDRGLRETTTDILTAEGYDVLGAPDGRAALDLLAGSDVDVLVLDLAMPRMSGVELLESINVPPPTVIICSALAYYDASEVREQVGSKVFRLLFKPVPPARLITAVAEALREWDAHEG